MALYELSIDGPLVREAEKVVSLEGRGFPTLVMRWDSRIFDQPWVTTIVLDYLIALPPLIIGQSTFNEVKVAAYVGGTPTKFLYFGTEMTANVPRIAPEMENSIAPAKLYQEFRLEEQTCPLPVPQAHPGDAAHLRQRPAGLLQPADQGGALRRRRLQHRPRRRLLRERRREPRHGEGRRS